MISFRKLINMAENVAPSPAKRARKPNFTPAECAVIFEKAEENINVIKSKFSSTLTNKNKSRVWEDITNKVDALGVCKRDVMDVKEKWRSMVSSAKKEHNKCAVSRKKTGGGKQPDSPRDTSKKLFSCSKKTRHLAAFPVVLISVSKCNVYKLLLNTGCVGASKGRGCQTMYVWKGKVI